MSDKPVIAIIGTGNLGVALASLLNRTGYRVLLGSRDPAAAAIKLGNYSALRSANFELLTPREVVRSGDINLLTVPDQEISRVCEQLAPDFKGNCRIAHCSGALDSSVLASAKQLQRATCSVHPLNTFPSIEAGLQTLQDTDHSTYLYGEGDASALTTINKVFETVGFHTATIARASKPLYHAACVFACNYLTVLMDLSMQTAAAGELDAKTFWHALQPLLAETIDNIVDGDTGSALSGPIARADTRTVGLHADALARVSGSIANTYLDLGRHALSLAARQGALDSDQVAALHQVLNRDKS